MVTLSAIMRTKREANLDLFNALTQSHTQLRSEKLSKIQIQDQNDAQLQTIISQLLLLEAQLRKEQKDIHGHLAQKDTTITAQRQEIERLRRKNRRLINRLKKMTAEARLNSEKEHKRNKNRYSQYADKYGETDSYCDSGAAYIHPFSEEIKSLTENYRSKPLIVKSASVSDLVCTSSSYTQVSETVNPNVATVRATTGRILHKPPIAEKPRFINGAKYGKVTSLVRPPSASKLEGNQQCNIVSTIHRLLEEESDTTTGSSEPSSPEATLKPATPRVIKLARKFDKESFQSHDFQYSKPQTNEYIEELQDEERTSKSSLLDEHEATSGYNSDAVSEHEYENIDVQSQTSSYFSSIHHSSNGNKSDSSEDRGFHTEGEENCMRQDNHVHRNSEDEHTYSNVDYTTTEHHSQPSIQQTSLEENDYENVAVKDGRIIQTSLESSFVNNQEDLDLLNTSGSCHNMSNLIDTEQSDHMTDNFEEFTLDSLELDDMDDGRDDKENCLPLQIRHCGDGAETKNLNSDDKISGTMSQQSYEKFLEATGLSQKSILTPTRMFSNHRSVLKPRDVKHRDKLRSAFTALTTLEESPSTSPVNSPPSSSKYWTEPYL